MNTKLILTVDGKILERDRKECAKRKVSLSTLVEDYLDRYSNKDSDKKSTTRLSPLYLKE